MREDAVSAMRIDTEQTWADLGVRLITVSHLRIERPIQCECGWRGRTKSQRDQHRRASKRHAEWKGEQR